MSVIILPNQLFENNELLLKYKKIYIYEHPIHFTLFSYHKLKIVLMRSSMKYYVDFIKKKYGSTIKYYEYWENIEDIFRTNKNKQLHLYDPIDHTIIQNFADLSKKYLVELVIHESPNFMCSKKILKQYIKEKNIIKHSSFYKWCRVKFNILMNDDKPIGNVWSYDSKNRLPFPHNFEINDTVKKTNNKYIIEAKKYVDKHFKNNNGNYDFFYLPITHEDAKIHFKNFLKNKLECFGPYQDAVSQNNIFGCHSVLSPLINIGLLNPDYIIKKTMEYYNKYNSKIESVEGFIRQIFWREYVMFIYIFYDNEFNNKNYFNNQKKISNDWYNATTQIKPIDDLINKVSKYGYLHHIERLMYIGNFMLISNIHPNDVYEWFMSFFIDAISPWVMKPNVYGMSQFSTGPFMMNRPYFSSSNYIQKMSSYKKKINFYPAIILENKKYEWFELWDGLYYNFINKNNKKLSKNYFTANLVNLWNKKDTSSKNKILNLAKKYLDKY